MMDLDDTDDGPAVVGLLFGMIALIFTIFSTILKPIYITGIAPCLVMTDLYWRIRHMHPWYGDA